MSRRSILGIVGVIVIITGLSARKYGSILPPLVRDFAPDALWASLVYCLIALIRPRMAPVRVWMAAFGVSVLVEVSQLYHAPWIDAIRGTRLGGLILGFGFLWSDLACYFAGCSLAFAIDTLDLFPKSVGNDSHPPPPFPTG